MIDEKTLLRMSDTLTVASDFTRLSILVCLLDENGGPSFEMTYASDADIPLVERSVSDLVAFTKASQSLVSHQLKVLRQAKLVRVRKCGRKMFYSLSDPHVYELVKVVLDHVREE